MASATESNVGKWDGWYVGVEDPEPYGLTQTYQLGADWLANCSVVEDWGCGKGWMRTLIGPDRYRGIDGSHSRFAEEIVDLVDYRSQVPGIFMRHVLEHNFDWAQILDNALASFTERMVLILFTPLAEQTHDMEWEDPPGVPNLSFCLEDLTERIAAAGTPRSSMVGGTSPWYSVETIDSLAKYGTETIIRLAR